MLVLSRRPSEKLVFPNLGITIEVLQVNGRLAKLGITAPDSVRVLRSEVADVPTDSASAKNDGRSSRETHRFRNRLNTVMLQLHLIKRQLETGHCDQASEGLTRVFTELRNLDTESPDDARSPTGTEDRPIRLLVVDDDANERELLAGLLQLYGFEVDTAADGLDALQYLNSHPVPDRVLLDLEMPRVDGHRTIQSIRSDSRYRNANVFAVSGHEPCEEATPPGLKGFDAWFPKPLDPTRLLKAICTRRHSVLYEAV